MGNRVIDPETRGRAAAPPTATSLVSRSFDFNRDTFTFANELVWEYRQDPQTGELQPRKNDRPPEYTHRCFVMARSVRQFFCHARFDPDQPVGTEDTYRSIIRAVVRRSPRATSSDPTRIVLPGYGSLRALSQARAALLQAECGPPWQSYFVWSHYRMVFPIWPGHQERMLERLLEALRTRPPPVVHLFRFPRITINHAVVLYGATESRGVVQFDAYDPNIPAHPVKLYFDRATRAFRFPPTHYWGGGRVCVTEAYASWPYR